MTADKLIAHAQYDDATGTVAIDWQKLGLHDFARQCGLDIDRFFPIGFSAYKEAFEHVTIIAVDRKTVGDSIDKISNFVRTNGVLPVKKFVTDASFQELLKHMQRPSIVGLYPSLSKFKFDGLDEQSTELKR